MLCRSLIGLSTGCIARLRKTKPAGSGTAWCEIPGKIEAMRVLLTVLFALTVAASCGGSSTPAPTQETTSTPTSSLAQTAEPEPASESSQPGPGGFGFDRSDPTTGVRNIMDAFAADEETATCIYDAWGDVANVPPAELTPQLMTYEICGTSIFQMITGDPRFTGQDE